MGTLYHMSLGYSLSGVTSNTATLQWGAAIVLSDGDAQTISSNDKATMKPQGGMQFYIYNLGNDSSVPTLTAPSSNPFANNQQYWFVFAQGGKPTPTPFQSVLSIMQGAVVGTGLGTKFSTALNGSGPCWPIAAAGTTSAMQLTLPNVNNGDWSVTFQINVPNAAAPSGSTNFLLDPEMIVRP